MDAKIMNGRHRSAHKERSMPKTIKSGTHIKVRKTNNTMEIGNLSANTRSFHIS